MIKLQSLRKGEMVKIRWIDTNKIVEAQFLSLTHDPKGARFAMRNRETISIWANEINAGWVQIERSEA